MSVPCDCGYLCSGVRRGYPRGSPHITQSTPSSIPHTMATVAPLLLSLLLVGGSAATTSTTSTTPAPTPWSSTPGADLKWRCPEVSVQANLTVQRVVGHWFVLELDGTPPAKIRDACFQMSLTDLHEESSNSSSVVLTVYRELSNGTKDVQYRNGCFFLTHAAQEFVPGDMNAVWRLHSLSDDGRVLVMVSCKVRGSVQAYWITLGVAEDSLPQDAPRRSATSVRRDPKFCRKLAETSDTTPSSN